MLRLVLIAAIVYLFFKWARRSASPKRKRKSAAPSPSASGPIEEMAQDPVCGTWVPLSQAVALQRGSKTFCFCSTECREKFLKSRTEKTG